MATKAADKLKASVTRLGQAQQAFLDLRVWVPLQAILDELKAAVESARLLLVYRDQVKHHKQIIDDAFKEVEENSREFTTEIDATGVPQAQYDALERKRQVRLAQVLVDPKEICTFNVGGHVFKIKKEILLKYPNSRLVETMQEAEVRGGELVVDRDPERFRHVLNFLRDDKMPKLSVDKLAEVTDELRFWEVKQALQIGQDEEQKELSPMKAELNALLSRDLKEDWPYFGDERGLNRWRDLGPLSVDEILAKAEKSFIEEFPVIEKKGKTWYGYSHIFKGQTNPATKKPFGIGRYVDDGWITEGFLEGNERNGWVRRIYHGGYYIGQIKDGFKHGQGKMVYAIGTVEEGRWERDKFKG